MEISEAIEYAITGNALLFCGSGFSVGATSISGEKFPVGSGLCNLLKRKLNIDEEDDDDLEYYSSKFKKEFGANKLIKLLEDNFTVKEYQNYHEIISNIDWRRIYTTNYDNIIEASGRKYKRKEITLANSPRENRNHKELIIHLNGSIKNLTPEKLNSEFKLTMASYSSSNFIENDWYDVFKNDIDSVKAIFFIGFSLKYDLDIRRAITSRKNLREKTFFIDSKKISPKNKEILSEYGQVYDMGVDGFAKIVEEIDKEYIKPSGYKEPLYAFLPYDKEEPKYRSVRDIDVINLLYRGEYLKDLLVHNSTNERYIFKRDAIKNTLDLIKEGKKFIILESDFGNGKTFTLNLLEYELNKLGHVFKLVNSDEDVNQDIDNIIQNYEGQKFIIIDNYHNYFKVLTILDKYNLSEITVILTERSYINDLLYSDLLNINQCSEKNSQIISLNRLSNDEVDSLIKLLDNFNLWGKKSKWKLQEKKRFIKEDCNRSLKEVLLEVFKSNVIKTKLDEIVDIIKKNKTAESIMLLSVISNLVNLDLNLDDYLHLLSLTNLSLEIKRDAYVNELMNIDKNEIKVKSSIMADFIISNTDYSDKIIDLLIKIMNILDKKRAIDKYSNIQFSLISFSNIQLLVRARGQRFKDLIIRYYESIKNNKYCNHNVFFWIQYANARISLSEFVEAKLCLDKADSEKEIGRNYPQYDTCYSRYLLENQLYFKEEKNAYDIFEEAHRGIYNNKNSKDRWHFPLKQTYLYYDYYKVFYHSFTETEKSLFILRCQEIYDKIADYMSVRNEFDGKANHRVLNSKKKLEYILGTYLNNDEIAASKNI
ncbi:hypothetical protein FDB29_13670 [Clostridium botulinum]|nr:hypothetical protein [Clostridium botulinum]